MIGSQLSFPCRRALSVVCLCLILLVVGAAPALASGSKKADAAVLALSGVGLAVPDPTDLLIGGFQLGYGLGCLIWDPPDWENASVPVFIEDFRGPTYPDAVGLTPSWSVSLLDTTDTLMDSFDEIIAISRAHRAAVDRYEGALILDDSVAAAERLAEANGFQQDQFDQYRGTFALMTDWIAEVDDYDANALSRIITADDVKTVRAAIAAGNFPSMDDTGMSAWNITQEERDALSSRAMSTSDSDIDEVFDIWAPGTAELPIRFFMTDGSPSHFCVPEPTSMGLLAIGGLGALVRRRRKRAPE